MWNWICSTLMSIFRNLQELIASLLLSMVLCPGWHGGKWKCIVAGRMSSSVRYLYSAVVRVWVVNNGCACEDVTREFQDTLWYISDSDKINNNHPTRFPVDYDRPMVDVPPEDCIAAIVNMRPGVLVIFLDYGLWYGWLETAASVLFHC